MQRKQEVATSPVGLSDAYAYLQKLVGIVAFLMPFVIAVGDCIIDGHAIRGSMSAYYYGRTGGYFVGSMCALGVFLISYQHHPLRGHESDRRLAVAAGTLAIMVALFPTSSDGAAATDGAATIAAIHIWSAGALFVLLGAFSLYMFTKTEGEITSAMTWKERLLRVFRTTPVAKQTMTCRKRQRNVVYRVAGWLILGSIAAIGVTNLFHQQLAFWFESIATVSFGAAWLVKGSFLGILKDPPN